MPTLLTVDDSPSIRQVIKSALEGAGFDVIEARDGVEGLEKATTHAVDLVITDINMPRMNGLALIRNLRTMPPLLHLPIIVLTTEGDPAIVQEAKTAGATTLISKPFKAQDILKAVADLLP